MMVKRILDKLFLGKIAAVDRPCQAHATMDIMKRAADLDDAAYEDLRKRKFTAEERRAAEANGHAMPGGRYPINDKQDLEDAIHAVGRGKGSHAAIRAHIKSRAKALGASDMLPDTWKFAPIIKALRDDLAKAGAQPVIDDGDGPDCFDDLMEGPKVSKQIWDCCYTAANALSESISSIVKDEAVADKAPMVAKSIQQFSDYVREQVPGDFGKTLAEGFSASIAGSAGLTLSKGDPMSDALKKALGLPATATEAEITKAISDLQKAGEGKVEKMTPDQLGYMAKLAPADREAFQKASAAERDKKMKDEPKDEPKPDEIEKSIATGDAFRSIHGQVITKKAAGSMFEFYKSQDDEIRKGRDELAKRNELDAVANFAKRATDIGFGADFGPTLRKAYGGDATAQSEVEKRILGLQKQIEEGVLFSSFGKLSPKAGSAEAEFMAKVDEVKKANPKLSDQQAYAKAYKDPSNADIKKRMQAEAA